MKSPLSQNELLILDRQMAVVTRQLSEIAVLLESRQGDTTDTAVAARIIAEGFADLARKIHNQAVQAHENAALASRSQAV
jgi:hypothetical protein